MTRYVRTYALGTRGCRISFCFPSVALSPRSFARMDISSFNSKSREQRTDLQNRERVPPIQPMHRNGKTYSSHDQHAPDRHDQGISSSIAIYVFAKSNILRRQKVISGTSSRVRTRTINQSIVYTPFLNPSPPSPFEIPGYNKCKVPAHK